MVQQRRDAAARPIRALFEVGTMTGSSDAELLERFGAGRGEAAEFAFAQLMERHGPMVLRVCRKVLGDHHAALDAFQATFLVLVRRSRLVRKADSIASWLHGVAFRVASAARSAEARRRKHEQRAAGASSRSGGVAEIDDLGLLLHREIARLPERYRAPLVLCHLEGLTHEQTAEQLGWPVGTVKSRLARGRGRLRERLGARGFDPAALPVAAAPLPSLVAATARAAVGLLAGCPIGGIVPAAAVTLMEGVVKSMKLKKWLLASVTAFAAGIVGTAAGVLARQQDPALPPVPAVNQPIEPAPAAATEPEVTYDVRFVEMTGLAWRTELHTRLRPLSRKGPYTVWVVTEETLREIGNRGKVVEAPRVMAFADAKANIIKRTEQTIITGYQEPAAAIEPGIDAGRALPGDHLDPAVPRPRPAALPRPLLVDTERIPDGVDLKLSGHRAEGGVQVRAEIEASRIVSIASTRVPAPVAPGDQPAIRQEVNVQVPEIIQSHFEGEWLVPADSILIVGLGVHRLPMEGGASELREQLVAFRAIEFNLKVQAPPTTPTLAPAPASK